jgi:hypothetical protein
MGVEVRNNRSKRRTINPGFLNSYVQGSDAFFPILVVGVGHGDERRGEVGSHRKGLFMNGTTTISAKRWIQWDRFQLGVSRKGRVHGKQKR